MSVLISVAELNARLFAEPGPGFRVSRTVVLDVRWVLGDPRGHDHYLAGHIPGAVFADMNTELAGAGQPEDGRHPLPTEEDFAATVRRWGINAGDTVVVYDDAGAAAAARAWWLLGYAGFKDVQLLDGGLAAWRAAGLPSQKVLLSRRQVTPSSILGQRPLSTRTKPPVGPGFCSTRGPGSGSGVRLSQLIRGPGTFPGL